MIVKIIIQNIEKIIKYNQYFVLYGNNILAVSHNFGANYFFYKFAEENKTIQDIYFNKDNNRLIVSFTDGYFASFDENYLNYTIVDNEQVNTTSEVYYNGRIIEFENDNILVYENEVLVDTIKPVENVNISDVFVFNDYLIIKLISGVFYYSSNLIDWFYIPVKLIKVDSTVCVVDFMNNLYYINKLKDVDNLRTNRDFMKCGLNLSASLMLDFINSYEYEEEKFYYYVLFTTNINAISNDGIMWFLSKVPEGTKSLVLNKNNFSKDIIYLENSLYSKFVQFNTKLYCIRIDRYLYNYTDSVDILDCGEGNVLNSFNINEINGLYYLSINDGLYTYDGIDLTLINDCNKIYTKILSFDKYLYLLSDIGDLDQIDINFSNSILPYVINKSLINFYINNDGFVFSHSNFKCFEGQLEVNMLMLGNSIKFACWDKNFLIIGENINFAITNYKNDMMW